MMRKLVVSAALFLLCGTAWAEGPLTFSGYLKSELSFRAEDWNDDLSKFKNIVELSGEYKLMDEDLVFFTRAKYWYDAAYDWRQKYDPAQDWMGHVQRTHWLRDCYFDYKGGPWFLRLGKQQVAWGQADGITILDRVNPVDLSEYWLPDMADIRIPLWMANINYSPKLNSNLQILIIPDFEQSEAAPPGAPFTFRSYNEFELYKQRKRLSGGRTDTDIFYPSKEFENSTFAVQWSDMIGDLSYTFNYLNGFYYNARTYYISGDPRSTTAFPVYYGRFFKRWRMYGASMNKTFVNPGPLQGITMRGDFAYYNDEPTYYGNVYTASTLGVNRWDNIFWLIGFDRYFFTNWLASFQYAQYIMQDAKPGVAAPNNFVMNAYTYGPQDQVENIFSFKISTDFLNEKLRPEVLLSFTDDSQGRVSPKVSYEVSDSLLVTFGYHYFYGHEWDTNGQFRDQSQLYANVKYSF